MKIDKIKYKNKIYFVTLSPNWFEKLFNVKQKIKRYKDSGRSYMCGGQTIYIKSNGKDVQNGDWISEKIDEWRKKF
jgi:hypothetical protein